MDAANETLKKTQDYELCNTFHQYSTHYFRLLGTQSNMQLKIYYLILPASNVFLWYDH